MSKDVPVYDYRPGHAGTKVAGQKVREAPKYEKVGAGHGEIKRIDHTPKINDGSGLKGGVMKVDKEGHTRIIYHKPLPQ